MQITYYTAVVFMSMICLFTMLVCARKSNTLSGERKKLFQMLFGTIIISAFCEWLGVFLDGAPAWTRGIHIAVKCTELSAAPCIAFLYAWIIEKKWVIPIRIYLIANCLLECLSGFFGFIFYVDEQNVYRHAGLYVIYVAAYMGSFLFCTASVMRNIKKYQYKGNLVFGLIVLTELIGVLAQLAFGNLKLSYLTLAMVSSMLYVFTLEMIQQTDELTTLLNRRGYENSISHMDRSCVIVFFDVNRFKEVNDNYGHLFGDEVLQKVGLAIKKSYARYGQCFRYGGDEFCVILTKDMQKIENRNHDFFMEMDEYRKIDPRVPTVSIGYTDYDPQRQNIQDAVAKADEMMYRYKEKRKQQ